MVTSFSCSATTWILALLLTMIQVHGQSSSDQFRSIDCGLVSTDGFAVYMDNTSGLAYFSDDDGLYVEGGLPYEISSEFMVGNKYQLMNEQQRTLRSFPNGPRNCYTFPSAFDKRYLLRAFFTYGNYDGMNRTMDGSPFLFGLHIGASFWQAVNLTNWDPSRTMWKEILTIARGNSLSVCLINYGLGTPFVSSLELRPLDDGMYPFLNNTSVSLSYIQRYRFGNITDFITRYPTDSYDRFWQSWSLTVTDYSYPLISLETSRNVNSSLSVDGYQVPQPILQSASTIDTNYSSMTISVSVDPNLEVRSMELLPIFHFAEIDSDSPNRTVNVYSASELLFPHVYPLPPMQVVSMYPRKRFLSGTNYMSFSLNKTTNSPLPPLINAFELYSLVRMEKFTDPDDVYYINEIKEHYNEVRENYNPARINWIGDPCSPREYTWDGLTCDYSSGNNNTRIVRVNMSTSGLAGELSVSFLNMTSLQNLDLSHNNLTGLIPEYQLMSIKVLNLSNNNLHGPVPDSILQRAQAGLLELRLEGNPVCLNNLDIYCSDKNNRKKRNTTPIMRIVVVVPVVLISLLVGMCILWKLYLKEKLGTNEDYAMYEEETPLHIDTRRFTYAELKLITNNFQSIIGKGGFGIVYHGKLENGDEVAVKVLMETSIVKSTDFLPEVQTLSKVHHKNLVSLQGYCQNKKCLALVYEFMPRGNLQQILRGEDCSLNWEQRLHIAFDAAQGLGYLHELCTPSIVHRDVKTPNILLDKNLVGIISDFGLSRAFSDAHTHISTVVAGTLGYLDPEYHATFQLTVKTDVYSFGIVLLEIITGKPPVIMDPQPIHLPSWVRENIANGSIHDVVDKTLLDQYDASSLQGVIDLSMNCVEKSSVDRPTMTEVISKLRIWLLEVSRENHIFSGPPLYNNSMDTQSPHLIKLMTSEVSNKGRSYTGGMSEISSLSGR